MLYVFNLILLILCNLHAVLCIVVNDPIISGLYAIRPKADYRKSLDCESGGDVQIYDRNYGINQVFQVLRNGKTFQIRCIRDGVSQPTGYWTPNNGWRRSYIHWDHVSSEGSVFYLHCTSTKDLDDCEIKCKDCWEPFGDKTDSWVAVEHGLSNNEDLQQNGFPFTNRWWTFFPLPAAGYNGVYRIKNVKNNEYMDCSTSPVKTSSGYSGDSKKFMIQFLVDATYKIRCESNQKVFDITHGSTNNGASLITYTWHGGDNQRFRFQPSQKTGDEWNYVIAVKQSGKYLSDSSTSAVQQYSFSGDNNQRWLLEPV